MKFYYADFVLENCEVLRVYRDYVKTVHIENLRKIVHVHEDGKVIEPVTCESAYVVFDRDLVVTNLDGKATNEQSIEVLAKRKDVSAIVLYDEDEKEIVSAYVPWESRAGDSWTNALQEAEMDENGCLEISWDEKHEGGTT